MKGVKRIAALLLASVLALLMLTGCGQSGGTEEKTTTAAGESGAAATEQKGEAAGEETVTYSYFTMIGSDFAPDNPFYEEVEKNTGVHLKMTGVPESEVETKVNLMAASGELPDIIARLSWKNIENLMKDDMLLPLKDLAGNYATSFMSVVNENKFSLEYYTGLFQNHGAKEVDYYAMPVLTAWSKNTRGVSYRKDIFQQNNLQVPATPDEFYNVLKTLKQNYPDSYPLMVKEKGLMYLLVEVMFGAYDYADDEIKEISDQSKNAFRFLNKLYEEKLVDQEFLTVTEQKHLEALNQGKVLVDYSNAFRIPVYSWPLMGFTREKWDEAAANPDKNKEYLDLINKYWGFMPYPSEPGVKQVFATEFNMGPMIALNKNIKNPERAMKFIDFFYSLEGAALVEYGLEGIRYDIVDGKVVRRTPTQEQQDWLKEVKYGRDSGVTVHDFAFSFTLEENPHLPLLFKANESVYTRMPELYNMNDGQKTRYSDLNAALTKKFEDYRDKFALGVLDVDRDWDKYINDLKNTGLDEFLKIKKDTLVKMDYYLERVQNKTSAAQP